MPIAARMRSSSCPERPTKGRPSMSSSRPGASPTSISRPSGLPSENTSDFAVNLRLQPSKRAMLCAQLVERRGARRQLAGEQHLAFVRHRRRQRRGARRALRPRTVPTGVGARRFASCGGAGGRLARRPLRCGLRGRARGEFGEAIDRVFLDRLVDAGLGVEFEQFANVCGQPILNLVKFRRCAVVPKTHEEGMRGSWTI